MVAQSVGLQVMQTPDIAPPDYEQTEGPEYVPEMPIEAQEYGPPPDQEQPQEQPADAGFFTPEQDQMQ